MVSQSTLRTCEEKQVMFENSSKIATVVDQKKRKELKTKSAMVVIDSSNDIV